MRELSMLLREWSEHELADKDTKAVEVIDQFLDGEEVSSERRRLLERRTKEMCVSCVW